MLTLIRNVHCFAPEDLGRRDVRIGGGQVLSIDAPNSVSGADEVIDGSALRLLPGLVDALTHPCGGGGEGGFGNRTPEISAEAFIKAGITSPIGALGTDSLGRSLDVLYANVMGLRTRGLNALMYTGAYRVPPPTLTGDVARDLFLVDAVIGLGEVAVADHRGSQLSAAELRRLGADTSLGGTLAGRGGRVLVHVGDGAGRLQLLRDAVQDSELPPRVFYPTHVNRSLALLQEATEWTLEGGYVDITVSTTPELIAAGDIPATVALRHLLDAGAPATHITMSSDAGGSLPLYENGQFQGLCAAGPMVLSELLAELREDDALYAIAVAAMTRNPAQALGLDDRGALRAGAQADLLLVDESSGAVCHVLGAGRWLLREGKCLLPEIGT